VRERLARRRGIVDHDWKKLSVISKSASIGYGDFRLYFGEFCRFDKISIKRSLS